MRIDAVTLFPEMFDSLLRFGVTGRAFSKGLVDWGVWNPRSYTQDNHQTVDDRPYGGGPGMVMMVEPLRAAIDAARKAGDGDGHVIYLSPQGRVLDQTGIRELMQHRQLVLVSGRYEGVDERLLKQEVDEEWSIGDYVLSGGELAAMVLIDALVRLIPGVLGDDGSAECDSFSNGLLDFPHYTRPEEVAGERVPSVLLSGNHQAIARWRLKQSLGRTWLRRPDLIEAAGLDDEQRELLKEYLLERSVSN